MDILILCLMVLIGWSAWIAFRRSPRHSKANQIPPHTDRDSEPIFDLKANPAEFDNMPEPHSRLFTADDEHQAFRAGQPVWIQYEDKSGAITERIIEIYRPRDDEVIYTWCRRKQAPRTFVRRNIHQWRLLPEHFDFDPIVARYWDEEGIRERLEKNPWRRWLQRQPKEIADRYK